MDELTREFLIESQEGLDRMERCLTELESRPEDKPLLAEIFRAVHTIKGTTGFLGFKRLERIAHAGENLLGMLRDGTRMALPPMISALLELLDCSRSILKRIETEETDADLEGDAEDSALIARLEALQRSDALEEPVCVPLAPEESESPAAPEVPSAVSEQAPAAVSEAPPQIARLAAPPASAPAAETTLRVDIALLNRMMNLVGELVLTRNQILQAAASQPSMTLLTRRLDMVTADLRESVMRARMQPVSNLFSKVPRMVRDLARTLGRRVRLEMDGQETELDRSLLEAIKDPLTHLVRNALDHGIESPGRREDQGKNPEGVLKLAAAQEGGHVILEIADDGAGIAVEHIRDKAIERGLVSRERSREMSDRELLQMIFLPGFSTARQVTNISGRGVGMDVVRTNVEKIGGKVEIDSHPGAGTTLRLRIPLTLAIIPALIVRGAGQSFALPQSALSELIHITPGYSAKSIEWIENAPLYRLRGRLLPLVFLDQLLGAPRRDIDRPHHFIAVLDAEGRRFGLVLDGLANPEEIVVKPLCPVLREIKLYSGATVLGNGDLALILDPGAIAAMSGIRLCDEIAQIASADAEHSSAPEYLVVSVAERQAGIPLRSVIRIEQIPLSRIEYISHHPVLNFAGQLLAIEDAGGAIAAAAGHPDAILIIVVCRDGGRHVGVVVEQVLDVSRGEDLIEAGRDRVAAGVTLVRHRITGVVDLRGARDVPCAIDES